MVKFIGVDKNIIVEKNTEIIVQNKVVLIVQARMGSTRLPGKSLEKIHGRPIVDCLYRQLVYSNTISHFLLATTSLDIDDELAERARLIGWRVFRGSEEDVLGRYYDAAKSVGCVDGDIVVRVTGDDIFIDPYLADRLVRVLVENKESYSHISNNRRTTFPYGLDIEVFTMRSLTEAYFNAKSEHEREHVTPYIRERVDEFPYIGAELDADFSKIYLSIDTPEDLESARLIYNDLSSKYQHPFTYDQVISIARDKK